MIAKEAPAKFQQMVSSFVKVNLETHEMANSWTLEL